MNKIMFECDSEEKENLELGDIFIFEGKRVIVCKLSNGRIGLLDTEELEICKVQFRNLDHITNYVKNIGTEDGIFSICANHEWIIYTP